MHPTALRLYEIAFVNNIYELYNHAKPVSGVATKPSEMGGVVNSDVLIGVRAGADITRPWAD
jgi:hypothetical protein